MHIQLPVGVRCLLRAPLLHHAPLLPHAQRLLLLQSILFSEEVHQAPQWSICKTTRHTVNEVLTLHGFRRIMVGTRGDGTFYSPDAIVPEAEREFHNLVLVMQPLTFLQMKLKITLLTLTFNIKMPRSIITPMLTPTLKALSLWTAIGMLTNSHWMGLLAFMMKILSRISNLLSIVTNP